MSVTTRQAARMLATTALAFAAAAGRGQDLYWGGGAADIADGSPLPLSTNGLSGVWNGTLKNWATAPVPGVYTTYLDGAFAHLGSYTNNGPGVNAAVILESGWTFSGLSACLNATTDYNRMFDLTAAAPRTLTPVAGGAVVNLVSQDTTRGMRLLPNVALVGTAPLEKVGVGILEIQSDSSAYTGVATVRVGTLAISAAGSFKGVKTLNCLGRVVTATATGYGGNEFGMGALRVSAAGGANDKLADDATLTLSRGSFDYRPVANSAETMGRVDVETWGVLGGSGTAGGVLTLGDETAGLTRGSTGRGMAMVAVGTSGNNILNLRVPNGLATDTLLPWLSSSRGGFMTCDGTDNNTLKQVPPTAAATDVSSWGGLYGSTTDLRIGDNTSVALTGALGADLTLRSLGWFNTGATRLDLGGRLLSVASGGLSYRAGNSGAHQIVTNGVLTTAADTLYLNSSDSGHSGALVLALPITGACDVVKAGISSVELSGGLGNTYTGTTVVQGGGLALSKSGGFAVPGPLLIRYSGSVNFNRDNQINPLSAVTLEDGGLLAPRGQTFSGLLTLTGGTLYLQNYTLTFDRPGTGVIFNGGYINHSSTATGTINLQTDVRYEASAVAQSRFERFNTGAYNIELDGGTRTFDIADSVTLADGVPEMVVDAALIPGSPAGGALRKTGAGTLQLTGVSTYTGGTAIEGGTLRVSSVQASARSGLTAYTSNTGNGSSVVTFNEPVAGALAVGQAITGTTFRAVTVVRVLNDYEILTSSFNLLGVSTNASVGALTRFGNLGTGPVAVTNAGTLKLDAGIAVTNTVRVFAGGTLAASGAALGPLTVSGGTLAAEPALGAVVVNSAVVLDGAGLTVAGELGDEPVTILSAAGGVSGEFANWPADVTVSYPDANTVVVRKRRTGTVIRVQ